MKSVDPGQLSGTIAPLRHHTVVIDIFGPLNVRKCGCDTRLTATHGTQELLGFLALHAHSLPVSRDKLCDTLWPEAAPDKARRRLRTALWRCRKTLGGLGAGLIGQNADQLWLNLADPQRALPHLAFQAEIAQITQAPDTRPDTERDCQMARLSDCLARYTAPLLDGLDADWIAPERARFADLFLRGLNSQLAWYRAEGRANASIDTAKTLLAHDPYREDVHAMLIGLYAATGQPRKALAQYRDCDGMMRDDLGLQAHQAQTALHDALLARAAPTAQPCAKSAPRPAAPPQNDLASVLTGLQDSIRALSEQVDALRESLKTK